MPTTAELVSTVEARIRYLQGKRIAYAAALQAAESVYADRRSPTWLLGPASVYNTGLVRELAPPVVAAARDFLSALNRLREVWTDALDLANNPGSRLTGDALADFRGVMTTGDEEGRQATWMLDQYYQSRWYEGNPERAPALTAYAAAAYLPGGTPGGKSFSETIYTAVVGEEYAAAHPLPGGEEDPTQPPRSVRGVISPWWAAAIGFGVAAWIIFKRETR